MKYGTVQLGEWRQQESHTMQLLEKEKGRIMLIQFLDGVVVERSPFFSLKQREG